MRILTGVLAFTGATLALSACGIDLSGTATTSTDTRSYEITDRSGGLDVHAGSGAIAIIGTDATKIVVREKLIFTRNRRPTPRHSIDFHGLSLGFGCPKGLSIGFNVCRVDYRIEVPRGMAVGVDDGPGHVRVRGLAGRLRVATSSGTMDISDFRGSQATLSAGSGSIRISDPARPATFTATASSGSVRAEGLRGGRFTGRVNSGSMVLGFTDPPSLVDAGVSSGSAKIALPTGSSYAVDAETASGSHDLDPLIHTDSRSKNMIKVRAGSGSVAIRPASGSTPPAPPTPPNPFGEP